MALPDTVTSSYDKPEGSSRPFKVNGAYYVFTGLAGTGNNLRVWKSTAPGSSAWTVQDSANSPSPPGLQINWCLDDNGKFHFVSCIETASAFYYHRFDTSDDSWEVGFLNFFTISSMTAPASQYIDAQIEHDATANQIRIVVQDDNDSVMGNQFMRVAYFTASEDVTTVGGFTGPTALTPTSTEISYAHPSIVKGSSGHTHMFWREYNQTHGLRCRSLNSSGTLSSEVTASAGGNETFPMMGISYDDAGTRRIIFPHGGGNAAGAMRASEDGSGNIASFTGFATVSGSARTGTAQCVAIDSATNDAYLFYIDSGTGNLTYSVSTDDGATWSTGTSLGISGDSQSYIASNMLDSGKIAYTYNVTDDLTYNELSLEAGATGPHYPFNITTASISTINGVALSAISTLNGLDV